jgi:hypothetical protein
MTLNEQVCLGVRGPSARNGSGHRRVPPVTKRVQRPGTPTAAGLRNLIRQIKAPCGPQSRPQFPSSSLKQDPALPGACTLYLSLFNLSDACFLTSLKISSSPSPVLCTSPDQLRINLDGKVGTRKRPAILLFSAALDQWLRAAVVEKLPIQTAPTTSSGQDWQ